MYFTHFPVCKYKEKVFVRANIEAAMTITTTGFVSFIYLKEKFFHGNGSLMIKDGK